MPTTDLNELYKLVKANDKAAINLLFELLTARFRLFTRLRIRNVQDAEEIVQNSLLVISKNIAEIEIEQSFSAWAYKVLENRMKAYFDRKKTATKYEVENPNLYDAGVGGDENLTKRQLLHCLKLICNKHPVYARILNLHYQGFTTEEICERLSISPTNLYTILSRSRSLLSYCLEKGEV